jgi:hypothetical protein
MSKISDAYEAAVPRAGRKFDLAKGWEFARVLRTVIQDICKKFDLKTKKSNSEYFYNLTPEGADKVSKISADENNENIIIVNKNYLIINS